MARFVPYDLPQDVKDKFVDLRWQMSANRMMLAFYRLDSAQGDRMAHG